MRRARFLIYALICICAALHDPAPAQTQRNAGGAKQAQNSRIETLLRTCLRQIENERYEQAYQTATRVLELSRQIGDKKRQMRANNLLALAAFHTNRTSEAIRYFRQASAAAQEAGIVRRLKLNLNDIAAAAVMTNIPCSLNMTENTNIEMRPEFQSAPPLLRVPDLTETLDFFTRRLGFRVDMIVPADAPKTAVISGQGLTLRLETAAMDAAQDDPAVDSPDAERGFVISRFSAHGAWKVGRAGMQYRDLIPGRLGGRFVASHIRIPDGGETPDYAHYHKVRFQMIYCKGGWVRVVYEDQGPPFVLEAGDCVLQPPQIRHRVLESSPGLEVIEIGSPAVHETWADHDLPLPTQQARPDRLFSGQRFVRHRVREASWMPWRLDGFEARDTGIAAATDGLAGARVVRANAAIATKADAHAGEFLFLFVLQGKLGLDSPEEGSHSLRAGDSCVIPANVDYALRAGAGLEFLEVSQPAELPLEKTNLI
jgi:quercetin dioxygenase-like cupin family protein